MEGRERDASKWTQELEAEGAGGSRNLQEWEATKVEGRRSRMQWEREATGESGSIRGGSESKEREEVESGRLMEVEAEGLGGR